MLVKICTMSKKILLFSHNNSTLSKKKSEKRNLKDILCTSLDVHFNNLNCGKCLIDNCCLLLTIVLVNEIQVPFGKHFAYSSPFGFAFMK